MDFDLTEEQRLLKDSVDRLVTDQYGFEQRKKYALEPAGYSTAMWDQLTELGLLGLPFEETLGGFGSRHTTSDRGTKSTAVPCSAKRVSHSNAYESSVISAVLFSDSYIGDNDMCVCVCECFVDS